MLMLVWYPDLLEACSKLSLDHLGYFHQHHNSIEKDQTLTTLKLLTYATTVDLTSKRILAPFVEMLIVSQV